MMAIAYIQQALVSNHSVLADSYYNLGEVMAKVNKKRSISNIFN